MHFRKWLENKYRGELTPEEWLDILRADTDEDYKQQPSKCKFIGTDEHFGMESSFIL